MTINHYFFEKFLGSEYEYWVVTKPNEYRAYGEWKRGDDSIIFIAIPHKCRQGHEDFQHLTIQRIQELQDTPISENVYLSPEYPPFQLGEKLGNFTDGFPITTKVREFFLKALELKSNNLIDYMKLSNSLKPVLGESNE